MESGDGNAAIADVEVLSESPAQKNRIRHLISTLDRGLSSICSTENHCLESNVTSGLNCQSESRFMYPAQLREGELNPHRLRLQTAI